MPKIHQLSPSIVNKIAAGEVIERPASVVKELLENSIDAGATRIELSVEKGGLDLIRISDNGCGITAEDLPLALAPHATSKIVTADDLFDVNTLGFRGEALASVAEISHLLIRSRTPESDMAYEITVRGGEREEIQPTAAPVGTTIEVRHLFFNTPVRRKFLKAAQTEMGHVVEAFTRIALAFPQVHMVLRSNDRDLYDVPVTSQLQDRIRTFFGDEVADALIEVDNEDVTCRLFGFVANPSVSRSNNRMQYLFLNGRHIKDRALQHALGEAYRGLLMVGRFPICFLRLEIPPSEVDVNVHPTKTEVRFVDSGRMYSHVLHTLRHKFLSSNLTANVRPTVSQGFDPTAAVGTGVSSGTSQAAPVTNHEKSLLNWAAGNSNSVSTSAILGTTPSFRPFPEAANFGRSASNTGPSQTGSSRPSSPFGGPAPWEQIPDNASNPTSGSMPFSTADQGRTDSHVPTDNRATSNRLDGGHDVRGSHLGFQIHNRYLITEDDSGMVVIDQHALHERILYEQIREKVLSGSLESQRLLVPEPVSLTPAEAAAALDAKDMLSSVGIEVEPFGGDTVLVTSYPAMLANISPGDLLRKVLEPLMSSGKEPDRRDLLDSVLHMISCKAAIKAGDHLTSEEITSLLEQRHCFQDTHHCPHGRPTALFFSRDQLDKMFKRT
jgi:DNA mismatch repair protein MutL